MLEVVSLVRPTLATASRRFSRFLAVAVLVAPSVGPALAPNATARKTAESVGCIDVTVK